MKKFFGLFIAVLLIVSLFATSAIAFAEEETVAVTGISFAKSSQTYEVGSRTFNVSASVEPSNASEKGVLYAMADASKDKGVTVDSTGKVTVSKDAEEGTYEIIATAKADEAFTATYTLTLTARHKVNYDRNMPILTFIWIETLCSLTIGSTIPQRLKPYFPVLSIK